MNTEAIRQDATTTHESTELNTDSASEAFLKQWKVAPEAPANTAAKGDKKTTAPVDAEAPSDDEDLLLEDEEDDEDPTESSDTDPKAKTPKYVEDDDTMVKYTVDGEEKSVSIKDLKRLAGQEASLTRKSMEAANRRKEAEEIGTYHAQGLARLVQMAEEEYAPYANIDFLSAAKDPTISGDELRALRDEATAKYQKYQFLTQELQGYTTKQTEQRSKLMHEQASVTIQELTHPDTGIPGWGPKLYEEVGNYALSRGMRPETFTAILDAPSLRVIHDAYRYEKAKQVQLKKKAAAPANVLKSSAAPDTGRFGNDKAKSSMSKLRESGNRDDAVSALLARWSSN